MMAAAPGSRAVRIHGRRLASSGCLPGCREGTVLHYRAGRRKEHTLASVLPSNQVGRCAIGAMYLDDDALAIHIADVSAFAGKLYELREREICAKRAQIGMVFQ